MNAGCIYSCLGGALSVGQGRFWSFRSPGLSRKTGHELVSILIGGVPTKVSQLASGTYRLVFSREIRPNHSSRTVFGEII